MSPILYAINIGTLATWLSVAGFGTVGIVIPAASEILEILSKSEDPYSSLETTLLTEDFATGELPTARETDTGTTGEVEKMAVSLADVDTLPAPPEMPDTAEISPLPRIPELPTPAGPSPEKSTASPKSRTTDKQSPTRSKTPTSPTGGSTQGKTGAAGKAGAGGGNGGSGMSDAKRLAGGRMPGPSYPAEARARGQSGTVLVEFIVGENGSVISAYAKRPSPWPILNERAVSCVRRWKFPPGRVDQYARPIIFKLN